MNDASENPIIKGRVKVMFYCLCVCWCYVVAGDFQKDVLVSLGMYTYTKQAENMSGICVDEYSHQIKICG